MTSNRPQEAKPQARIDSSLRRGLADLASSIRNRGDEIEAARRLPADIAQQLRELGLFRALIPASLGGLELEVRSLLEAIEILAEADGATGWCGMIGATSSIITAYLPEETAADLLRVNPKSVFGGTFAPLGRAELQGDSFVVSGRWPFASGCQHCTDLVAGSILASAGPTDELPGPPRARMMLLPADSIEILDTWRVVGLAGTGSHDFVATRVRIPRERSASFSSDQPWATGPLYRFPVFGLLALGIAAVSLGIARRSIDELVDLARGKVPTLSQRRLAERPAIQAMVSMEEARLGSARAYLFESVAEAWLSAERGDPPSLQQRAKLRSAATWATHSASEVCTAMYRAGGGTSIYDSSSLQRCFRDAHVATQHVLVGSPVYEVAGRIHLDLAVRSDEL